MLHAPAVVLATRGELPASMICRLVSSQDDGLKAIAALRCLFGMLLLAEQAITHSENGRDPKNTGSSADTIQIENRFVRAHASVCLGA